MLLQKMVCYTVTTLNSEFADLKENITFCLKNGLDMVVFAISEKIKNQLFRNS